MAAILNVRAIVRGYGLAPEFRDALLKLLDQHVAEIHSTTRISRKALSIKTQEKRTTVLCKAFMELKAGGYDSLLGGLRLAAGLDAERR
nr:hypothetical protein [Paraburkholderia madseniana]